MLSREAIRAARLHIRGRRAVCVRQPRKNERKLVCGRAGARKRRKGEVNVEADVEREDWVRGGKSGGEERGDETRPEGGVEGAAGVGEGDGEAAVAREGDGGNAFFGCFACCAAGIDTSRGSVAGYLSDMGVCTYTVPEPVIPEPRLVPTFGPETTKSGAVPSKNGGPVVWMPERTEVTLRAHTQ